VNPDLTTLLNLGASALGTIIGIVVVIISASVKRNVKDMDEKVQDIKGNVARLAETGARHGESLAAGVNEFKNLNRRLDKVEGMVFGGAPTKSGSWPLSGGG
jgi:hypothetical protein